MQLAYETRSNILYVQSRQKGAISNAPQARFSNDTVASNRTYASESAVNAVREKPNRNLTENEYSTVEENDTIGRKINEATPKRNVKQDDSDGYDLAKLQMKIDEDSEDYDHLEHLGLDRRPDEGLDPYDTYANAHTEGFDSNDTYSHVQNGQYFHIDLCTSAQKGQSDDTYEHARNIGYDDSDTYDHSRVFVHDGNEQFSDYV